MGRALEPVGGEDEDEDEGEEEELTTKRRKVVLLKAQETSPEPSRLPERRLGQSFAAAVLGSLVTRNRLRPGQAGPAGRIREWLGHVGSGGPLQTEGRARASNAKATPAAAFAAAAAAAVASVEAPRASSSKPVGLKRPPKEERTREAAPAKPNPSTSKPKAVKAKATKPAEAPSGRPKATLAKAHPSPAKKKAEASKVSAKAGKGLRKLGEAALRSASPCSPETSRSPKASSSKGKQASPAPQAAPPMPPPALGYGGAKVAGSGAEDSGSSRSPSRQSSSSSRSPSPAPAAAASDAASRPAKRLKTAASSASAPDSPNSPSASKVATPVTTPPRRPVLSAADEGSFQAMILDRLRTLCGETEHAEVLAEYIVVMVAGSKGREEMSVELKPFFQDQAQAESFVDWVEECKWNFLTGGPSPAAASTSPVLPNLSVLTPRASHPADFWGPAPNRLISIPVPAASSRIARQITKAGTSEGATKSAKQIRSGPHVAVTSRVVLQPNPNFDDSPSPPPSNEGQVSGQVVSKAPTVRSTTGQSSVASKAPATIPIAAKPASASLIASPAASSPAPVSSAPVNPMKKEKNELLENMTKQLQLILTKLQDKTLSDDAREKYQALAQNVQTQMSKITKPAIARGRR